MEIWKDVFGYEGLYQVSNLGRVKSIERFVDHPKGGKRSEGVKHEDIAILFGISKYQVRKIKSGASWTHI